jgi:cell shape-determining protein MreC
MAWAAPARKSGFLLLGLVLLHLVVISGQVDGGHGVSLLERAILATLSPPQALLDGALRGVARAWHGYVDLRGVREENQRLQAQVDVLEQHLQEKQEQVREAERLRVLLGMRAKLAHTSVAADVK